MLALSLSSLYFFKKTSFFHAGVFITQQVLKMSHVFYRYKRQYAETDTFVFNVTIDMGSEREILHYV